MPKIDELTNKAMLVVGGALLTASMSLMGLGLRAYANQIYAQRVDVVEMEIAQIERRIYEIDQVFEQASGMDHATAARLGADKGYYESTRATLLRQREGMR